jgi:hypothetical protein
MSFRNLFKFGPVLLILFLFSGCAQYVITQEIEKPIDRSTASCSIGAITDELPVDFDEADKPTLETIDEFKQELYDNLENEEIFLGVRRDLATADYEVTGSILDYKKGSGFLRFMFGFVGEATITVELRLVNMKSNEIVFSGNFKGSVTGSFESGNDMFKRVSRDFAKALKKGLKKLDG